MATAAVLAEVRDRLDAACPEWRWEVYARSERALTALEVEFHFARGGRVRGALVQRPSRVPGEAA